MFRCGICGVVVPPYTKAVQVVLEARPRRYPPRAKAHRFRKDGRVETKDDPGGQGFETVREVKVCPSCAAAREAVSVAGAQA